MHFWLFPFSCWLVPKCVSPSSPPITPDPYFPHTVFLSFCESDVPDRPLISAVCFKVSLTHFSGNLIQMPIYNQHMWQRCSSSPLTLETPAINQRKALTQMLKGRGITAWLKLELEPKSHHVLVFFPASASQWRVVVDPRRENRRWSIMHELTPANRNANE